MQFAILFIIAFLIGLGVYRFWHQWIAAVAVPMILFTATTLLDHEAKDAWAFTLVFGLPLVFFAALLGAYVIQIREMDADLPDTVAPNNSADEDQRKPS
jgi:hypothetical protein